MLLGIPFTPSRIMWPLKPHAGTTFILKTFNHSDCSASNYIIHSATVDKVSHRVVRIFINYKEVYQIYFIELACNYSLFVYIYCILSIHNAIYGSDIFSFNYMYIIIIEPKQTISALEPVFSGSFMGFRKFEFTDHRKSTMSGFWETCYNLIPTNLVSSYNQIRSREQHNTL